MSGGSYEYLYRKIEEAADALKRGVTREWGEPQPASGAQNSAGAELRRRFAEHLELVAKAMHDIEWVDSCDYGPGDEVAAIEAVLGRPEPQPAAAANNVVGLHHTTGPEVASVLDAIRGNVVVEGRGARLVAGVIQYDCGAVHPFYSGSSMEMLGALEVARTEILREWAPWEPLG